LDFPVDRLWIEHQTPIVLDQSGCLPCLIIRLIIQTIRRDPIGSVWIDEHPT
jgi:hypothetical protein